MREIKFRAWVLKHHNPVYQRWNKENSHRLPSGRGLIDQFEKETKQSFKDGFISAMEYNICISDKGKMMLLDGGWDYQDDDKDAIVMQFTGLYDKNGKEIYEGDILRVGARTKSLDDLVSHELCKIDFSDGSFNVIFNGEEEPDDFLYNYSDEFGEVVGNIYENPELL